MTTPLPTLPVPVTWTPGPVKAPLLRAQAADAIAFLTQPPSFSGSQQLAAQSFGSATEYAVALDTEQWDNYTGHNLTEDTAHYYPAIQGWYLCEAVAPLNYTGGAGTYSVQIGGVQNNIGPVQYTGQIIPNPASAPSGVAAKLMQGVYTIPLQSATISGDNMGCWVYQTSGSSQSMLVTATKYPQFTCKWVCALTGTAGLPLPPLASWPVPPSYVTSAFLNANIRDTIGFLTYPPMCEYEYLAGTNTLASQAALPVTGTTIALDTVHVDTYSSYSTGTGTWTAPVAGVWYAYFCCCLSNTAASSVAMAAGLTITSSNYNSGTTFTWWGGTMQTQPSAPTAAVVRKRLRLSAGDTISPAGFQNNSASNAATIGGVKPNCCTFIALWTGI